MKIEYYNCHGKRKVNQPSMNAFQLWEVVVQKHPEMASLSLTVLNGLVFSTFAQSQFEPVSVHPYKAMSLPTKLTFHGRRINSL